MTEMTFIRDNKFAMTRDAKIAGNPEWGPIQKNCPGKRGHIFPFSPPHKKRRLFSNLDV